MTFPDARALATAAFLLPGMAMPSTMRAQEIQVDEYGITESGETVRRHTLTNAAGMRVAVMSWGATLLEISTPDREGRLENITLHLADFAAYERGHPLFGSVVGRYANRIDEGGFVIDGVRHDLATVNAKTGVHIHGGAAGLAKQVWESRGIRGDDHVGVELTHRSPDGHEGYPGQVELTVTYRLTSDNRLEIEYRARTDRPTHLNLTNHAYFNLGGAGSGEVRNHLLTLRSDRFLAIDERKIPTGEFLPVQGTSFDFRKPRRIGERLDEVEGGGYDHCYVIENTAGRERGEPVWFARLEDPESGRVMEVSTTQPGVQLYTGNYLKSSLSSPDGRPYGPHHGVCLETQHFPDSPNKPHFPSTLVRPGREYRELTVFRFSVE